MRDHRSGGVRAALAGALSTLAPGYFALVMATGILSVGVDVLGHLALSRLLLVLAAAGYALLVVLTGLRAALFPAALRDDLRHAQRGFGFFTFVAATDVLGARLALGGNRAPALVLLAVGACAWLVLGYAVPCTAVLGHAERPLLAGANGTWFVWVVATQSVAVLAAGLEPEMTTGRRELALLAVLAWSVGVALYVLVAVLVAVRLLLHPLAPEELTPPYWVAMGATAITVLAGSQVVRMATAPAAAAAHGLVAGLSVVLWSFGTWLVPPLVAAGWWRHVRNRVPLRYDALLWSLVFPLGMYAVATHDLGTADHLPLLRALGQGATWFALAVWAVTFVAMLVHLLETLVRQPLRESR